MRAGLLPILACALAGALSAAQARAQDPTSADMRCFIAMAAAADTADAQSKTAMMAGVIYYLGKLDGRTPSLDLAARAAKEGKAMTDKDFNEEAVSCAAALLARGQAVQAVGQRLQQEQSTQSGK
jgi:hypothetical protein